MTTIRIATEIVFTQDPQTGEKKIHSFHPITAGKICPAVATRPEDKKYAWVQVINGTPVAAFTAEECLVQDITIFA